jgi:hypothetical protein
MQGEWTSAFKKNQIIRMDDWMFKKEESEEIKHHRHYYLSNCDSSVTVYF